MPAWQKHIVAVIRVLCPGISNALAAGRFGKRDFIYIARDDQYRCPAGELAIRRFTTIEHGMEIDVYWTSSCPRCAMKAQCTTSDYRRIRRWKHESVLDAMQERLDWRPEIMRIRRETAEHPFGTIKLWMGSTHFLMKTLTHVRTEMSLHVLAYNLKRLINSASILLKAGESPQKGWSVVVLQVEYGAGGRVKIDDSDTCFITFNSPCYFAVSDGSRSILVDAPLDIGDTTASLAISGERIYVIKSMHSAGRGAARAAFGILGALATQPSDPPTSSASGKDYDTGPLSNVRAGSAFDVEIVSVSDPGKATGFVRPADPPPLVYPR
jgi:hypothetical protein